MVFRTATMLGFMSVIQTYPALVYSQPVATPAKAVQSPLKLIKTDAGAGLELWQTALGQLWIPKPGYYVIKHLEWEETVEKVYDHPLVHVRSDDVVIDCGAHIGGFTRVALQAGARLVVAIEPEEANLRAFRRNLESDTHTQRRLGDGREASPASFKYRRFTQHHLCSKGARRLGNRSDDSGCSRGRTRAGKSRFHQDGYRGIRGKRASRSPAGARTMETAHGSLELPCEGRSRDALRAGLGNAVRLSGHDEGSDQGTARRHGPKGAVLLLMPKRGACVDTRGARLCLCKPFSNAMIGGFR